MIYIHVKTHCENLPPKIYHPVTIKTSRPEAISGNIYFKIPVYLISNQKK